MTIKPLEGRWAKYDMRTEVRGMFEFMSVPEAAEAAKRKQAAHSAGGSGNAWWGTIAKILETSHRRASR